MKPSAIRLAVPFLLAGLLSACGGPAATDNPASTAVQEGPVELVFYSMSRDSEASFNDRYGDAIRRKFPKYTSRLAQPMILEIKIVIFGLPAAREFGNVEVGFQDHT